MGFSFDLEGQVNQMRLQLSKSLWPLFETVVNAIQSIEDSPNRDCGRITIEAKRLEGRQIDINGKEELTHFSDFIVTDNGNGFNDENYTSFFTAYSRLKIRKGCKGIGRFLWLKAFRNVRIESNYWSDGWKERNFAFGLKNSNDEIIEDNSSIENYCTKIILEDFANPYRDSTPLSLEALAKKLVEHCLPYFLRDACPQITLIDDYGEKFILNDYYKNRIEDSLQRDMLNVKGKELMLYHFRVKDTAERHELHFCANSREVKTYELSKRIPNLQKKIACDESSYFYVGYLLGDYLDSIVDVDRMGFHFGSEGVLIDDITEENLLEAACNFIKAYLEDDLKSINDTKRRQIDEFVQQKKPQYRFLLNQDKEAYDSIPAGLSEQNLELELHKRQQIWEMSIFNTGKELEKKVKENQISDMDLEKLYGEFCAEVTDLSRACLADYIVKRKVIVTVLEKALEYTENGRYNSEASVHSIICPMRKTSDQVPYEDMNLWLIDDRLSYHYYLASDIPMNKLDVIETDVARRMDIAIFDSPIAVSSQKEDFNSVTVIEFKKPGRNDYSDEVNPINQVFGYVEDIRSGKKKLYNGRPFGNMDGVAFYCYVIADISDTLAQQAKYASLFETPDRKGYYGYNFSYKCYVEVISYSKLLKDAKLRNQILFDKLFEPNSRCI